MKTFKEKFNYAVRPYLFRSIATTIASNIAYYFLFIVNTSNYSEPVTNLLIPVCFAALVQLIVLRPFINRFKMPPKQNYFGVNFLSFILLCAPLLVSIPLTKKVLAKVVTVKKVSEILASDNQYYYEVKNLDLSYDNTGESFWTERKRPKNGKRYTELNLVLVAPVKENGKSNFRYWVTKNYSKKEKSTEVPAGEFDDFRLSSLSQFKSNNTAKDIVYLEKLPVKWVGSHTNEAVNDIMYNRKNTDFVVLEPHYKSLAGEIWLQILFLSATFVVVILIWCLTIWKMKLKQNHTLKPSTQNWTSRKV